MSPADADAGSSGSPQPTIVLSLPPIGRASTHRAARLPELARKPSKYGDLEKMLAALLGSITPVSTPTTTAPRKQPNRDVKCACGACGYLTRTARKWLDQVGLPHCPGTGRWSLWLLQVLRNAGYPVISADLLDLRLERTKKVSRYNQVPSRRGHRPADATGPQSGRKRTLRFQAHARRHPGRPVDPGPI
jgi:hypothetical protein